MFTIDPERPCIAREAGGGGPPRGGATGERTLGTRHRFVGQRSGPCGMLAAMQWHWGNIGSVLAGLSTVAIAVGALIRGPAVVRSWLDR
jgi:hypothetical protein